MKSFKIIAEMVLIFILLLAPLTSSAKDYAYYNKDVSLTVRLITDGDSVSAMIKFINRSEYDIYIAPGLFYVHDTGYRRFLPATQVPPYNILDLGILKSSQDYLHIPQVLFKVAPHDSLSYTDRTEIPRRTADMMVNFDYLNSGNCSKKTMRRILKKGYEGSFDILDDAKYREGCERFSFVIKE